MARFLDIRLSDFEEQFSQFLTVKREFGEDVNESVSKIIADVRTRGDSALIDYTLRYDDVALTPETLRISEQDINQAASQTSKTTRKALEISAERIRAYHLKQRPTDVGWTDDIGAELGWRWSAIRSVGLYVPGGQVSYPSTLLMNAIPAKVAGVERLAVAVPTPRGELDPVLCAAARIAGIREMYRIGGAQAVAALAYGTHSIPPVDKITGPGNVFVAAAKRRVYGHVGVDLVAGPSEVLIIADEDNDPEWIALDLISQAEHDVTAQAILITNSAEFGHKVAGAVNSHLESLPRKETARQSWRDFGAIINVRNLEEAADLSNRIAPEHLEVCVADPKLLSDRCIHAGAIFLGSWTPEAIGDYVAGASHVLPTARSARFSSGLNVMDFLKCTTITRMTPQSIRAIGPIAENLAESEKLHAHARSVRARLGKLNG